MPAVPEQYGATASEAEGRAIEAFGAWMKIHVAELEAAMLQRPIAS